MLFSSVPNYEVIKIYTLIPSKARSLVRNRNAHTVGGYAKS